jgi:hypothetical protein
MAAIEVRLRLEQRKMKDELARLSEHIGLAPSQFVLGVTGEAAGEGQAGGQGAGRQSAEALLLARVNGLESAFREYVQAELDIHKDQDAAAPDLHGQLNATRCGTGVLFAFSLVLCHICPEPVLANRSFFATKLKKDVASAAGRWSSG